MAEYIHVDIVKSTPKAHLIEDSAGRQAWIQKRWLHQDGTVKKDLFERQVAEKLSRDKAAAEDPNREFLEDYYPVQSVLDKDEATAVMASWGGPFEQEGRHLVWFPKSMIKDDKLPGWLIKEKAEEVVKQLSYFVGMPINEIEIEIAGYKFYDFNNLHGQLKFKILPVCSGNFCPRR